MNIYSSTKASPYVYILTHKVTKQFYIGFRCNNVKNHIPSHLDIFEYQSSSKKIKEMGFLNFDILILAEFLDKKSAYEFEQETIKDNFKNPLCLNKTYFESNHFVHSKETHAKSVITRKKNGTYNNKQSTRDKISQSLTGIKRSIEHKQKISTSKKGIATRFFTEEDKINHSKKLTGHKKNNVLVTRIEDRKVMNLCVFTRWCNKSYRRPVIGPYKKVICRIYDRKEMSIGHFHRWMHSQLDT